MPPGFSFIDYLSGMVGDSPGGFAARAWTGAVGGGPLSLGGLELARHTVPRSDSLGRGPNDRPSAAVARALRPKIVRAKPTRAPSREV